MGKLIAYCNLCDQEIIRIPGVNVEFPSIGEKERGQLITSSAADHLSEEHTKEELAAYLRGRGHLFWRTTLE